MKVAAFQPAYPYSAKNMPALVSWLLESLDACDPSMDLIVLPEGCNAMGTFDSPEDFYASAAKYAPVLIGKVRETAARCQALVAVNLYIGEDHRFTNTTQVYGKDGNLAGAYQKQHLPVSEAVELKIVSDYTKTYHVPYFMDAEGVRYAFLTCYDCYFPEYIQHIAAHRPDVLIVCSLQRGETMNMLSVEMKLAAFQCNAYLVRSSVSMGDENYGFGASTMVVSPKGDILDTLGQRVGILTCEIDPGMKHYRPNTFGHPDIRNDLFIENGRTPWAYRACGPATRPGEALTGYPRICACRGFSAAAPENSMASFGLAVALGAPEIELDVWPSRDGELVVCHDETVDRTSDGHGRIPEMDWAEIAGMDIGKGFGLPHYQGLRFPRLQDVLAKFSGQIIVNLDIRMQTGEEDAVKQGDRNGKKIIDLIYEYDMQDHIYITGEEPVLKAACAAAPELPRAAFVREPGSDPVKLAKKYNCQKVWLFRGHYNPEMVKEAHEAGIRCIFCRSDNPEEVPALIADGIDTILTTDYLKMAEALERFLQMKQGEMKQGMKPSPSKRGTVLGFTPGVRC